MKNNGITINDNGILNLKVGDIIVNPNFLQDVVVFGKKANEQDEKTSTTIHNGSYHFNIDLAVQILDRNTSIKYNQNGRNVGTKDETQSIGRCAMYVRKALNAGGFNTTGNPYYATDYGSFLGNRGWSVVSKNDYKPEKGDIIVIHSFIGKKRHPAGHIQMYNGKQWVSDFKQRTLMPGNDYRKYSPNYVIFRFN